MIVDLEPREAGGNLIMGLEKDKEERLKPKDIAKKRRVI